MRVAVGLAVFVLLAGCGSVGGTGEAATSASPVPPDGSLYAVRMKACLERSGYTVEVTEDGGVAVQFAPDEASSEEKQRLEAAYDAAYQGCLHETGYDYVPSVNPEEEFRTLMAQDECLREHGIPVDSPSYEEFLQGQYSDWSALPVDPVERAALEEACGI